MAELLRHLPILEGEVKILVQILRVCIKLGQDPAIHIAVFQDNSLPAYTGGRILIAYLDIKIDIFPCFLIPVQQFSEDAGVIVESG